MASEAAEIALEGVPFVVDNYEKVYDPLKDKTKQGFQKVKEMRSSRDGPGGYESEDEIDEYDGPPRRSNTGGRRRSPRGSTVEERYAYSGPARARSAGRSGPRDRDGRGKPIQE